MDGLTLYSFGINFRREAIGRGKGQPSRHTCADWVAQDERPKGSYVRCGTFGKGDGGIGPGRFTFDARRVEGV